jgi:glycosyltransferase involved in cell wall biosynthesis
MSEKIGCAIITCNRPVMFKKCLDSIMNNPDLDEIVIVNDGLGHTYHQSQKYPLIQHIPEKQGVAKSKNDALLYLMDMGCDHIFLIEDDMFIKDPNIFQAYIDASKKSGIQHLMFGYHGPANKNGISRGKPCPRLVVDYGDFSLAFNQHCVGAFCYYSRKALEDVGLIDEKFRNAFDHVSHSYELALKGYSTPYWWWADLANSLDYIEEQACSEENSSIKTPETMQKWSDNIRSSMDYFKEKFGVFPFGSDGIPDTKEQEVLTFLKNVRHENRP